MQTNKTALAGQAGQAGQAADLQESLFAERTQENEKQQNYWNIPLSFVKALIIMSVNDWAASHDVPNSANER